MKVEVEHKFSPPARDADLGAAVVRAGGSALVAKTFTDTYFDTASSALARKDVWLRRREGAWEIKLPAGDGRSGGERTAFEEVEGEEQVRAALQDAFPGVLPDGAGSLDDAVEAGALVSFAEFTTTRRRWRVPTDLGDLAVDADEASFGHGVVELELLVADKADVAAAEARVATVAAQLELQPCGASGGKLEVYIRRHAPATLAALVDAGILAP